MSASPLRRRRSRAPQTRRIAALAEAAGLSQRRFIDRFRAEIGLTPKRFCRVRRFQQVLHLAHSGGIIDWPDVAQACGYFDQAHLIHDFRAFCGLTPTGYLDRRGAHMNHVALPG
jgi:AraC-like DNA-binding protein